MRHLILISMFLICFVNTFSQNKSINVYNNTLSELSNTIGSFSTEKYSELISELNSPKYNIKSFYTDEGGNAVYFYKSTEDKYSSNVNLSFNIYPNPTNGFFSIEFNSNIKDLSIEILDITGKKIAELYKKDENSIYLFDISDYTRGVYFLKLKNKDSITIKRLIKL